MRTFLSVNLYIVTFVYFFSFTTLESKVDISAWDQYKIIGYIVKVLSKPFRKESLNTDIPLLVPNRLLLYGPPGNGKTTLAYEIAKAADCEFVHLSASSIVTSYQGSGAENIKKELTNAYSKILERKRPVVVFIDEIDAIAIMGNGGSARLEHNNAVQELWQYLDDHKHDSYIFIICATNRYEELSPAFVSRFPEQQRIKLDQPDEKIRKKVLLNLIEKYELILYNLKYYQYFKNDSFLKCDQFSDERIHELQNFLDDLAHHSNGMSIRELENFIYELKVHSEFEAYLTKSLSENSNKLKVVNSRC